MARLLKKRGYHGLPEPQTSGTITESRDPVFLGDGLGRDGLGFRVDSNHRDLWGGRGEGGRGVYLLKWALLSPYYRF